MIQLRRPPGRCVRVGHRGAAALASENTLRSLEVAVELGCDMVELDVLPLTTLHYSVASSAAVHRVHDAGAAVYVWTVDDPRRAERLVDAGADGIITNDPRIFATLKT